MVDINPKALVGRLKTRAQFTPVTVLNEIHEGMTEGADKYGPYNWRDKPIEAGDYYDAALRHLNAWWDGEDIDPDSPTGAHHVSKAITGLIVLRDAMLNETCIDDRPGKSDINQIELPLTVRKPISIHLRLADGSSITNVTEDDLDGPCPLINSVYYNGITFEKQADGAYQEVIQTTVFPRAKDKCDHKIALNLSQANGGDSVTCRKCQSVVSFIRTTEPKREEPMRTCIHCDTAYNESHTCVSG